MNRNENGGQETAEKEKKMNGNGNNEVLRKFLEAVEHYNSPESSSEKKGATLIIDGAQKGTTEQFLCGISFSPRRLPEEQGTLRLGFSDDNVMGLEKVEMVVCLKDEFRFPLRYYVGYRSWLLDVPCEYSMVLRDHLDCAVDNGAVRIEVRMKKEEA